MLRNPFVPPRTVRLKIDEQQGFYKTDRAQILEMQYPYRQSEPGAVHFGDTLTFRLGGYEEMVFELRPAAENQWRIEGPRYTAEKAPDGGTRIRLYAPQGATEAVRIVGADGAHVSIDGAAMGAPAHPDPFTVRFGDRPAAPLAYSPASLRAEGESGQERTLRISASVEVPADFREARLAFLVEPEHDLRGVKAEALDNQKPVDLTLENGGRAAWHWFWANLAPGKHELAVTIHLPAAPGTAHVSGWLLTGRTLASRTLTLTLPPGRQVAAPPPSLLPASPEIERATYTLLDESIR